MSEPLADHQKRLARHRAEAEGHEGRANRISLIRLVTFAVAAIGALIALMQKEPIVWMSYVPLAPLFLLMISGVYLFVLPYAVKWPNVSV